MKGSHFREKDFNAQAAAFKLFYRGMGLPSQFKGVVSSLFGIF